MFWVAKPHLLIVISYVTQYNIYFEINQYKKNIFVFLNKIYKVINFILAHNTTHITKTLQIYYILVNLFLHKKIYDTIDMYSFINIKEG